MKEDLKSKGHIVRGYTSKEELERLAIEHEVELTYEYKGVEEGWCGKHKFFKFCGKEGGLMKKM